MYRLLNLEIVAIAYIFLFGVRKTKKTQGIIHRIKHKGLSPNIGVNYLTLQLEQFPKPTKQAGIGNQSYRILSPSGGSKNLKAFYTNGSLSS